MKIENPFQMKTDIWEFIGGIMGALVWNLLSPINNCLLPDVHTKNHAWIFGTVFWVINLNDED